jgi:hypothetical protein
MDPANSNAPGPAVDAELRTGIHRIRGALTELFASVGADPTTPQVVARTVGINRNLAWKLSKIIGADEPLTTVEHLPGGHGVEIMLRAFETAGAPEPVTGRVRSAMTAFEQTVEQHVGDRETLDLMLAHMLPRHLQIERAEAARRLAFRGNSAIWGIQARLRLSSMIMAPNADEPALVDIATIGGLIDYRRLRAGTSWPLLRVHGYDDDGSALASVAEPIEPPLEPDGAPLLAAFCTGAQPPIVTKDVPGGVQFELGEGPVGNQGLLTSIFGTIARRFASCYRDEANTHGEQMVNWFTPVTTGLVDLVAHRALPFDLPPALNVFGRMTPTWGQSLADRHRERIPLPETVQHLGEGPPVMSTPLMPEYANLMTHVFERLGWDPRDFTAYRLVVNYPPTPTNAILSFALGERP